MTVYQFKSMFCNYFLDNHKISNQDGLTWYQVLLDILSSLTFKSTSSDFHLFFNNSQQALCGVSLAQCTMMVFSQTWHFYSATLSECIFPKWLFLDIRLIFEGDMINVYQVIADNQHYSNLTFPWYNLTGGNWQKWKRVFLTCSCHEIYRDEAVGLKSCKNTWKITIFVKMWNLGQYRENLIFCQ